MAGRKKRPALPTEWRTIRRAKDRTTVREPLRAPTIFELAELRVAVECKHAGALESLLGEANFRTLLRLFDWQHHQLSPPQPIDQDFIDFARWNAFKAGLKEEGWDGAGEYAAEQLRDTPFAAGADMMKKSYQKIEQRRKPPG